MIKRVIFDQDKTLVSWLEENWNTLDETFQELNYPFTVDKKINIMKCLGNYENHYHQYIKEDMYHFVNETLNESLPINWIDVWLEKLSNRKVVLEPHAKEILEYLKPKYELVILTNWFSSNQINVLKKAGIYHYFDDVIGADEVVNKPRTEAFLKAIGNHNPEECMMIGDTFDTDILGAYQAGLEAIWYNPDYKEAKQKIKVIEIDHLEQLKNYL